MTEKPFALIVEDDYDLATIFAGSLQEAGAETEIVRSGDRALERLAVVEPDVVLLDLRLPQVAGTEILEYIRADPRLQDICVIVATAHPHVADSLRDAANLVLVKPVSFSQLRDLAQCFLTDQPEASPEEVDV